jgi:hypothetical protein
MQERDDERAAEVHRGRAELAHDERVALVDAHDALHTCGHEHSRGHQCDDGEHEDEPELHTARYQAGEGSERSRRTR